MGENKDSFWFTINFVVAQLWVECSSYFNRDVMLWYCHDRKSWVFKSLIFLNVLVFVGNWGRDMRNKWKRGFWGAIRNTIGTLVMVLPWFHETVWRFWQKAWEWEYRRIEQQEGIIEWFELKGPYRWSNSNPPAMGGWNWAQNLLFAWWEKVKLSCYM